MSWRPEGSSNGAVSNCSYLASVHSPGKLLASHAAGNRDLGHGVKLKLLRCLVLYQSHYSAGVLSADGLSWVHLLTSASLLFETASQRVARRYRWRVCYPELFVNLQERMRKLRARSSLAMRAFLISLYIDQPRFKIVSTLVMTWSPALTVGLSR